MINVERTMNENFHTTLVAKPEGYVTASDVIETIITQLPNLQNGECGCNEYSRAVKDFIAFVETFRKDSDG